MKLSQLNELFNFQAHLMEKLAPVERELGYTPPPVPLDFNLRQHQDWFRLMSWYLTEEIVEAMTAKEEDYSEELADCLHFAIELCILAKVEPHRIPNLSQWDMFDDLPTYTLMDTLQYLGRAVNLLKAKHWKKNPQPTDLEVFRSLMARSLHALIQVIKQANHSPYQIYMAKHKKNEERIQSNY